MKKLTIGYSVLADRAKNITPPNSDQWELVIITQGGQADLNFVPMLLLLVEPMLDILEIHW